MLLFYDFRSVGAVIMKDTLVFTNLYIKPFLYIKPYCLRHF